MARTNPRPPPTTTPPDHAQAGRLAGWLERLAARLETMPAWWSRPDRQSAEGSPLDARAAASALRRAQAGPPATHAELEHADDAAQELPHRLQDTAEAAGSRGAARAVEPGVGTPPEPYPDLPPPGRDEVPLDAPGIPPDEPDPPPLPDGEEDEPTPDEEDDRAPDAASRLERRQDLPGAATG